MRLGERALPVGSPRQRALLAFLLLHANELVPRERLIEALWNGSAPATVNAVLNGYLTKLRRLLGNGDAESVLVTQAPGYVLRVARDAVDAARFEDLVEEARRAAVHGQTERAASTLRVALALWRGTPFVDLGDAEFAQAEIRRLEEVHVAALEDRIEADLALGRHESLVAELERLVLEHPYRERLHGQLMLALYRSGRQAEALEVYRAARRTLVADLGLEPSRRLQDLELAILRHDPAVEPPPTAPPRVGEQPRAAAAPRRRWVISGAVVLAIALALAVVGAFALHRATTQPPKPIALVGNSVAVIDPKTATITREIPIRGVPGGIAVGAGAVWVGNGADNTLLRINPETKRVETRIKLGAPPLGVAVNGGTVWVLSTAPPAVLRVDPKRNRVVRRIALAEPVPNSSDLTAAGPVLYVQHGGALSRIDPARNAATIIRKSGIAWIDGDEMALWAISRGQDGLFDVVERIAPGTSRPVDALRLPNIGQLDGIAAGAGAVWTAGFSDVTLFKIDPETGRVIGGVPVGHRTGGVVFGEGAMWVIGLYRTILRVDPRSGRVLARIPLGVTVAGPAGSEDGPIAVGYGAVWVATLSL